MVAIRNAFCCFQKSPKLFFVIFAINFIVFVIFVYNREIDEHESFTQFRHYHWDLSHIGVKEYPVVQNYEKKDWHDYEFMKYEASREGPGEQGRGVNLTDPEEIVLNRRLAEEEGLNVILSDKMSVNRSIWDTRPQECKWKKYLKNLPSTSVIIIFYNEWPSILLRTVHSVYNRTPRELLKEIILVDDNSSKPELHGQLDNHIRENFDGRVRIVRLPVRRGLIVARMEGAKQATGEVLVFLDSHMEIVVNWLPPLLEPIVLSPTTVTTPTIDSLDRRNFKFVHMEGSRGVFDDLMWFQWFPLRRIDNVLPDAPHQIPIMLGAAFAIRRDYFSDIGQYDEGLMIWNGEQIEISFKLHLCGGDLLEVPCSRASHIFRTHHRNHELQGIDVAARNFKRVAEVWMEDYKHVMYRADPDRFNVADPGDLTKAKLVKQKLKCKPFDYFFDKIVPEMYTRYYYQLHYPGYYAFGAIQSDASPRYCIDFMDEYYRPTQLYECNNQDLTKPGWTQYFKLTWHKKLRLYFKDDCFQNNAVMDFCHYNGDHKFQDWKYDIDTKQLISYFGARECLTAGKDNLTLSVNPCDKNDPYQRWNWGTVNETALRNYEKIRYEHNQFYGFDEL